MTANAQAPAQAAAAPVENLLEVRGLKKYFPIHKGLLRRVAGYVKAVDDVNFTVRVGETLGLVGESGCGKSTAGRSIIRLYEPTAGEVLFRSKALGNGQEKLVNMLDLKPEEMKLVRQEISMVFQDPINSLNPRMTVSDNEPVSALDVSIQAQTLNLLQDLQQDLNLSYIFVAHDLSVVQHISDRIAVMYVGKVAELAPAEELYSNPLHPYTEALLSAVPKPDPKAESGRIVMQGDVADPSNPPSGCYFHPRCRYAKDLCKTKAPEYRELKPDHFVSCHFAEELKLEGI